MIVPYVDPMSSETAVYFYSTKIHVQAYNQDRESNKTTRQVVVDRDIPLSPLYWPIRQLNHHLQKILSQDFTCTYVKVS